MFLVKNDVGEETFNKHKDLTLESSLEVIGKVVVDKRAPSGFELHVQDINILHIAQEYPIAKKEHGVDFLLNHRHLWLRSRLQIAIMRIRNEIVKSIRDYFYDDDFVLIDTPILTGSIGESASTLFDTEYF